MSSLVTAHPLTERSAVLLVATVMFVNILDFMMVMPLGPDFALALGIPLAHVGRIAGSYTVAAMVSGVIAALVLDAIDRKRALLIGLCGLCIATLLCGVAWDMTSLMLFRAAAGAFGGPVTAVGFAILADVVAPERRGRAVGKAMGAFSLASVAGVPFGLEVAHYAGWNAPFFVLALAIAGVAIYAAVCVPSLPVPHGYAGLKAAFGHVCTVLRTPIHWAAYAALAIGMTAAFMLVPNIAAHVQLNLGYPRADMGLLYFVGGMLSLFGMRFSGAAVDRWGATPVVACVTLCFVLGVWAGFIVEGAFGLPVVVVFSVFMVCTMARNIAVQSINSRVPAPHARAAFTSLQSAVTNAATSTGAFVSASILETQPNHALLHVDTVGWLVIVLSLIVPVLVWFTERWVRTQEQQ